MIGWSFEPSVTLGSLLLAGGYVVCIGPRRTWFPGSAPVSGWRISAFLFGVATLFLALATPLDDLSDHYLLSAHMVQHLLLTLVMPPLLLLGTPGWLLRSLLRSAALRATGRFLSRPLVAFLSFNVVLAFSHFPLIYNFALENERAHVVLHLAYMTTAVITWWPVLSPLPELPRLAAPLQMLYLFFQTIPGALVGSMVALGDGVLYPTYAAASRISGLSALGDQQLGGLIMWLGVSTYMFTVITVLFFIWAHREEAQSLQNSLKTRSPGADAPNVL